MKVLRVYFLAALILMSIYGLGQARPMANSNPAYQQLRKITLSGEAMSVANLVLKRDAGVFTFKTGTFYFTAAVEGKVTGAVFQGQGEFALEPPLLWEKVSL